MDHKGLIPFARSYFEFSEPVIIICDRNLSYSTIPIINYAQIHVYLSEEKAQNSELIVQSEVLIKLGGLVSLQRQLSTWNILGKEMSTKFELSVSILHKTSKNVCGQLHTDPL